MNYVIIGGGIAGLSAANTLAEEGLKPILLEAEAFGRNKVCGEFFSPETAVDLERWGVPVIPIHRGHFRTPRASFTFEFRIPAGSVSRPIIEQTLADRAALYGADIRTYTKVTKLTPPTDEHRPYEITLADDSILIADRLIIATGRVPHPDMQQPRSGAPRYRGFKVHMKGELSDLHMYMSSGSYLGVTPVSDGVLNISCLADDRLVTRAGGIEPFFQQLLLKHPVLKKQLHDAERLYEWLSVPVYGFGAKTVPAWPQAYFVGDARATIYPASGNGLSMGLSAGIVACEYAQRGQWREFSREWDKRYKRRIAWARLLHEVFMREWVGTMGLTGARFIPSIAQSIFYVTRR